ncbi:DUF5686 family protein [Cochleicola gelatinilyticus]|uniref:Uncharacterized protein n=1 Tax=Cochleicola gelatinilyticus TaxID=1763537 RepID=A0A167JAV4_9FLAO|nr:DUF5686 family protein [Cochleicola gelatinilyticus]OAB80497.1 hypothetical protein ULVI_07125 [Cochleicola gelatinilyticus]
MRHLLLIFILLIGFSTLAQEPAIQVKKDTSATRVEKKQSPFSTGYYPLSFFDFDLKYLIKYNNYEGLRLGAGGVTNNKLSEKFKISGYVAHGFKDKDTKFSLGGSIRLNKEKNTWINAFYIDDIEEIGRFNYLTDARVYSVFEPRLVNVTQFYKHRTWQLNLQNEFSKKFLSEVRIGRSRIEQIENYRYLNDGTLYNSYETAEITASVRISPKTNFFTTEDGRVEYFDGFPKISAQVTQGIKGITESDFNYTKFGLKLDYYIKRTDLSSTNILLEGNLATGDVPLTHLFHAYPNSPTKDQILQRFSVAGRRSFETMYFGEFFSDKLTTLQVKHSLRRFYFSERFKPELVFITKHALGSLSNKTDHVGLEFNTLEQIYSETGFELNKLIFGFGLSFAYRYGYYNLPEFEDNVSFKFTFYLKL